jgi:hypothetical protein
MSWRATSQGRRDSGSRKKKTLTGENRKVKNLCPRWFTITCKCRTGQDAAQKRRENDNREPQSDSEFYLPAPCPYPYPPSAPRAGSGQRVANPIVEY